ncbi:unnamed protein product [Allacma fusca]|uniref:Uncharacterized protein n=1 Tax=Allacma fusca TaxID=39272 RepID=A0A8J2NZQ3_9HEXA|nr:unnamed protein product [Allacma fusca]
MSNEELLESRNGSNRPGVIVWLNICKDLLYILICSVYILTRNFIQLFVQTTPKKLKDEIILVTGGANGIGREICRQLVLLERNLTVITWDVNEEENIEVVKDLKNLGIKQAFGFTVDVSEREQVEAAAKKIRDEIGDTNMTANVDFLVSKYDFLVKLNMTPSYVASRIISGMRNHEEHIFIPGWAGVLKFLSMVSPDILRKSFDILTEKYQPVIEHNGNKGETPVH